MSKKVDYIKVFRDAIKITWRNRFLWWFGLFVTLGSIGNMNYSFNRSKNPEFGRVIGEQFQNIFQDHLSWLLLGAALVFLLLALRILGKGALIKSAHSIANNQLSSYRSGFKEGKKYFLRLIGLGIFLTFFLIVGMLVLATPVIFLFANGNHVVGVVLAIFAILILIPLVIIFVFLKEFSSFYIVLGDLKIFSAIESAYALFEKNILSSIIFALLFIPLGIIIMFLAIMLLIPLAIIFLVLGFISYLILSKIGAFIVLLLGVLVLVPAFIFIRSIWEVFAQTAWVLFFQEIASPKSEETIQEKTEEIEEKEESLPEPNPVKTIETEKHWSVLDHKK